MSEIAAKLRSISDAFDNGRVAAADIGFLTEAANEIERLSAEHGVMVEALEKLSRLGNEPHLGNSDGNKIAQHALASVSGRRDD